MSSHCCNSEFERQCQSHIAAFALADQWQRNDAMRWFLNSLSRLHYFKIVKSQTTLKNRPMVEVRAEFSLAKRLPELVQIDLANVWAEVGSRASKSFFAFHPTAEGFDGQYLAVFGPVVVTFILQVVGTR